MLSINCGLHFVENTGIRDVEIQERYIGLAHQKNSVLGERQSNTQITLCNMRNAIMVICISTVPRG
jgi:hypothetical protein